MKTKPLSLSVLAASVLFLAAGLVPAGAAPVAFDEVSLLVRMRDGDAYILQQINSRGLLRALSPQQERRLKAEGASDSLIAALRTPDVILPPTEASAFEQERERQRLAIRQQTAREEAARVTAEAAAAAEAKARLAAQAADEEAAARRAALAPKIIPVTPGDIDYNDFSNPVYGGTVPYGEYPPEYLGSGGVDPGRFLREHNRQRPDRNTPGGPTHIQYGSTNREAAAPRSPITPTGPTGSTDRSVTPLSGNATFVPNSGRSF